MVSLVNLIKGSHLRRHRKKEIASSNSGESAARVASFTNINKANAVLIRYGQGRDGFSQCFSNDNINPHKSWCDECTLSNCTNKFAGMEYGDMIEVSAPIRRDITGPGGLATSILKNTKTGKVVTAESRYFESLNTSDVYSDVQTMEDIESVTIAIRIDQRDAGFVPCFNNRNYVPKVHWCRDCKFDEVCPTSIMIHHNG